MQFGYDLIKSHYADKTAKRSGVPLINHINEGLEVLRHLHASLDAQEAFCIHPMLQSDEELKRNYDHMSQIGEEHISPKVLMLAMEYRNIANQYLSHRKITYLSDIKVSPIVDVNHMLLADKIQNYKDFLRYHAGTHERTAELNQYFKNWLDRLSGSTLFEYFMETRFHLRELEQYKFFYLGMDE
jgi:hypothetical protein